MKKYYTHSDGGCFLFGNKEAYIKVPNGYGDCKNTVLVFDNEPEFLAFSKEKYGESTMWWNRFKFIMKLEGCINLYNYDCADRSPDNIAAKFEGEYSFYLRSDEYEFPTLAIVKS